MKVGKENENAKKLKQLQGRVVQVRGVGGEVAIWVFVGAPKLPKLGHFFSFYSEESGTYRL